MYGKCDVGSFLDNETLLITDTVVSKIIKKTHIIMKALDNNSYRVHLFSMQLSKSQAFLVGNDEETLFNQADLNNGSANLCQASSHCLPAITFYLLIEKMNFFFKSIEYTIYQVDVMFCLSNGQF